MGEEQVIMRVHRTGQFIVAIAISVIVVGNAQAQGWGDLKARFVLDGEIPAPKNIVSGNDEAICKKHNVVDEQLVVNPMNKGIANIIVSLAPAKETKLPIHESYEKSAKGSVALDNLNCRFEPRVTVVRTTQSLQIGHKDPIGHNTNVTMQLNASQNQLIPPNGEFKMTFSVEENFPATVQCNIHPWMKGYLVVKAHPYVGVSDKDGNLLIKDLPVGKWTFVLWQESSGYVTEGVQDGKGVKWARGRAEIEIKAGGTDMKEIKVPRALFKLN
jgi:hypothetical protein